MTLPLQRSLAAKHREAVWLLLRANADLVALIGANQIINGPEKFRAITSVAGRQINVSNVVEGEETSGSELAGIANIDIPIYVHYWHPANAAIPLARTERNVACDVTDEIQRTIKAAGNGYGRLTDPDGGPLTLNVDLKPARTTGQPDPDSNMHLYRVTFVFGTKVNSTLTRSN